MEGKRLLRGNEYIRGYQHLRDQPASKGQNALAGRINLRPRIAGLILSAKQLKDATSCRTQYLGLLLCEKHTIGLEKMHAPLPAPPVEQE